MRIGIEAQRVLRTKKAGMDIVVLHLILELQKMELPHDFFLFVKKGEDNNCLPQKKNFTTVYVEGDNYAYWEQIQLPKEIKKYALDIIHFTSDTAPLSLRIPSKKILTLHDIMFLERGISSSLKGNWYQTLGNFYRQWIVPKIVHKMNKIITVSHAEQKLISHHFSMIKDNITTVHNGVSHEKFADIKLLIQKYQLPQNYFFHIGNSEPRKNTEGVLKSFCEYKKQGGKYELVLNGISQKQLDIFLYKHDLLSIQTNIRLLGYLSTNELHGVYETSKGFIYPSFREGFGLPPLEAMLHHIPVIASNQNSIIEVCGEAAHYINPYNNIELTTAFFAFENKELQKEYAQKGDQQVQKYSWSKMAKEVLEIYEAMN